MKITDRAPGTRPRLFNAAPAKSDLLKQIGEKFSTRQIDDTGFQVYTIGHATRDTLRGQVAHPAEEGKMPTRLDSSLVRAGRILVAEIEATRPDLVKAEQERIRRFRPATPDELAARRKKVNARRREVGLPEFKRI